MHSAAYRGNRHQRRSPAMQAQTILTAWRNDAPLAARTLSTEQAAAALHIRPQTLRAALPRWALLRHPPGKAAESHVGVALRGHRTPDRWRGGSMNAPAILYRLRGARQHRCRPCAPSPDCFQCRRRIDRYRKIGPACALWLTSCVSLPTTGVRAMKKRPTYGAEAEAAYQISPTYKIGVFGDYVRGKIDNENAPRVPAGRLG